MEKDAVRRISIMGSTGSIGSSAVDVIAHANSGREPVFEIEALVAGQNTAKLAEQATLLRPAIAVIADESKLADLRGRLSGTGIEVAGGNAAVLEAAERPCDRLLAAIVGAAGLASTLAAVRQGTDVAIANKESIVCGGRLILSEAKKYGVKILPVDSEHNAIFQVLEAGDGLEKLTITASGGPFLSHSIEEMKGATPAQAAAHPNWDMGIKNSIDSATLMNKALEFIEAAYLFDLPASALDVLIHPQSIIHGMAHYVDGSVLAQLGSPDMRTPISYALGWPRRIATQVARLDLVAISQLDFAAVDRTRFPAIDLAREAIALGNGGATVLNCSNETAVSAFIAGNCGFMDISWVVSEVMNRFSSGNLASMACETLEEIEYLDQHGRQLARALIEKAPLRAGG